jgi:hypothetical protein
MVLAHSVKKVSVLESARSFEVITLFNQVVESFLEV